MTARQVATNAAASRWLAERLTTWGIPEPEARADWLLTELLKQGIAPVPTPPPLRGKGADPDHRAACKAAIDEALARARSGRAYGGAR